MNNYIAKKLEISDSLLIREFLEKNIYYGYPYTIERCVEEINSAISGMVVFDGEKLIAVSIIGPTEKHDIAEWKALAVDSEYRGKRFGKMMVFHSMNMIRLSRQDIKSIFSECWVHPTQKEGEATSDILFKNHGFIEIFNSNSHWKYECDSIENFCPHRKDNICECKAKVLLINL